MPKVETTLPSVWIFYTLLRQKNQKLYLVFINSQKCFPVSRYLGFWLYSPAGAWLLSCHFLETIRDIFIPDYVNSVSQETMESHHWSPSDDAMSVIAAPGGNILMIAALFRRTASTFATSSGGAGLFYKTIIEKICLWS